GGALGYHALREARASVASSGVAGSSTTTICFVNPLLSSRALIEGLHRRLQLILAVSSVDCGSSLWLVKGVQLQQLEMAFQEQSSNIALLQETSGLVELQQRMQLSLVATPLDATSAAPSVADIYEVIEDLCGKCYLPTLISTYAPDFILHFESEESRDVVHRLKVLPVLSSGLSVSMWTPYYRSQVIAWETEVEICVSNIPVEACHPDILLPLLSSRCDIRSYNFDKSKGTCQLVAFTSMPAAIPKSASIAYPVRTPVRTILMTHPVSISTRAAPI
ncbi:unnamed protein product, partial [Urochloa humidicola]